MKHIRFAGLFALPMLVACTDRSATSPDASLSLSASANPVRPFTGVCSTAITFVAPHVGDAPNSARLHIAYVCQLSHLGRTTAVAEQYVVFTGPTTGIANNTTTYTAANGDELFATWSGTFTSTGADIAFGGPETYVGGTGRFANATGSSSITGGTASLVSLTGQFTMNGSLSY